MSRDLPVDCAACRGVKDWGDFGPSSGLENDPGTCVCPQDPTREDLLARITVLHAALVQAREDLIGWGAYADECFRTKWHFDDDVAAIDRALAGP